ncbi:MAG: hypothetical protein AB2705_14990 [Candidatus Thiodiazotropha sp.]
MKIFRKQGTVKEAEKTDSVLLSLFMCSNVMAQHCSCPLAPASAELYFQTDQNEPINPKGPEKYNLHYDDVPAVKVSKVLYAKTFPFLAEKMGELPYIFSIISIMDCVHTIKLNESLTNAFVKITMILTTGP